MEKCPNGWPKMKGFVLGDEQIRRASGLTPEQWREWKARVTTDGWFMQSDKLAK